MLVNVEYNNKLTYNIFAFNVQQIKSTLFDTVICGRVPGSETDRLLPDKRMFSFFDWQLRSIRVIGFLFTSGFTDV